MTLQEIVDKYYRIGNHPLMKVGPHGEIEDMMVLLDVLEGKVSLDDDGSEGSIISVDGDYITAELSYFNVRFQDGSEYEERIYTCTGTLCVYSESDDTIYTLNNYFGISDVSQITDNQLNTIDGVLFLNIEVWYAGEAA